MIIATSDAKELEGLCDTVYVMSRGHVVRDLVGDEITEANMIHAAVTSTMQVVDTGRLRLDDLKNDRSSQLSKFLAVCARAIMPHQPFCFLSCLGWVLTS